MIHIVSLVITFFILFVFLGFYHNLTQKHKQMIDSKGFFYEFFVHAVKIICVVGVLYYTDAPEHAHGLIELIVNKVNP